MSNIEVLKAGNRTQPAEDPAVREARLGADLAAAMERLADLDRDQIDWRESWREAGWSRDIAAKHGASETASPDERAA